MGWLYESIKWVFDGIGTSALGSFLRGIFKKPEEGQGNGASLTAQGAKVLDSPVATGTNVFQTVNSPTTVHLSMSVPKQLQATSLEEEKSKWPDVILECDWPAPRREVPPRGVRPKPRPWLLKLVGIGAVYDVQVEPIDLGDFEAVLDQPLRVLTTTAEVYPRVYHKTDTSRYRGPDLETVINSSSPKRFIQQYVTEYEAIGWWFEEGIEAEIIELEIPVWISYTDKHGDRFKIEYLLHYSRWTGIGEMRRAGSIVKVIPNRPGNDFYIGH